MLRELKKIFKDSVIYGLGGMLPKLLNMLLIPVYTRVLTPTDYGILSLASLLASMLAQVMLLGLAGSVTRFYRVSSEQTEDDAGSLLYTVVLVDLIFGAAVTVLLLVFGPWLFDVLPIDQTVKFNPYMVIAISGAFLGAPFAFAQAIFRARGKASRHTAAGLASFALNTGFTIYLVVVAKMGAAGSLLGTTIAAGIMAPWALWELTRVAKRRFSWPLLRKSLAFGLPLVPHFFAGWVLGYADRLVLQRYRSVAEVGMYAVAYSVGMGMSVMASAVNQSWAPTFYDLADNPDTKPKLRRLTTLYAAAITLIGIAYMLVSRELTQMLAADSYWRAMPLAPIVVGGYFLQAMYYVTSTPTFFMKRTRLVATISGVAAGLNIAANILLVPKWGMEAAAWVTVATFGVMAAGTWIASSRLRPGSFQHGQMLSLMALFTVMLGAEFVVASFGLPLAASIAIKVVLFAVAVAAMFALRIVSVSEASRAIDATAKRVGVRKQPDVLQPPGVETEEVYGPAEDAEGFAEGKTPIE